MIADLFYIVRWSLIILFAFFALAVLEAVVR